MLFSQNLTTKGGFAQNFTPKSDRILENVPYFLKIENVFFLIPWTRYQSSPSNPKKQPLFPNFLGQGCLQYYTWLPPPPEKFKA